MLIDPVPDESPEQNLTGWYDGQTKAWGFRPNYAAIFAGRPEVAHAWTNLNLTVRDGMDRRRFELANIAAARVYECTYCLAAHSKFLRDVCGDEPAMRSLAAQPDGQGLDKTDAAIVEFCTKVAAGAADITAEDVQPLRDHGLTDADIADLIFVVGSRAFFATVLDGAGALPDRQLGEAFDDATREQLTVGRPFAR